jgi:hypothetical protein
MSTPESPHSADPCDAYAEEPFASRFFFDHPAISRALRTTFAEKRLGRAIFMNILILMIVFIVVQQLFTRGRLAFQSEEISFARTAFLAFATAEANLISLFLPMSFFGVFYTERKEQCFDQVVATGVSPLRLLSGRLAVTLAFFGMVLLSALPFFMLTIIMNGATISMVVSFYSVMAFYMLALSALTLFSVVAMDDTGIPVLYGLVSCGGITAAGFSSKIQPAFGAFSPIRHVTVEMGTLMKTLGLGTFNEPTVFGTSLPCEWISLLIYLAVTIFALGYVLVGPDLELAPGLNSFDTVAVGRKGEVIRGQRLLTSTLLRTLQIRFFYENSPALLKKWSPMIRVGSSLLFVFAADIWFLGSIWPSKNPSSFGGAEKRFVYSYLGFIAASFMLLAILGTQARSALRDRRAVLKLGSFKLGRFPAMFAVFFLGLIFPVALALIVGWVKEFPFAILPDTILPLFLLILEYAVFIFCLAILCAFTTSNPFSASGRTLLALTGLNIMPFAWIIMFYFKGAGESLSWILDFSPFFAGFALLLPTRKIPFSTIRDGQPYFHNHDPSALPFALLFGISSIVLLGIALLLARRIHKEWIKTESDADHERTSILKGTTAKVAMVAILTLLPLTNTFGQDKNTTPEDEKAPPAFEISIQAGFSGRVSRTGFSPLVLSILNNTNTTKATVQIGPESGTPIASFNGTLQADVETRFEKLLPSHKLSHSAVEVRILNPDNELLWSQELSMPGTSVSPIVLIIDRNKAPPFDLSKLNPSMAWSPRTKLRQNKKKRKAGKWRAAYIDSQNTPRSALGFTGIHAVILGNTDGGLDPRRASALTDWVARGGDLIISIGDRAKALRQSSLGEALNDEIFECMPGLPPQQSASVNSLQELYDTTPPNLKTSLATLKHIKSKSTVLLQHKGNPLILSQSYGSGRITLLAFDLWEKPFLHWANGSDLLSDLLSSPPNTTTRASLLFPVLTTIQTSQAKIAPAFTALLLYAFIAGPLLYFILKQKNIGLMAWIIIPSIILIFTLLTPLYSLILKESDSAYFGVTLIESFPNTKRSMVTSDLLLFSGGKEAHTLTIQRPNAQAYTVIPTRIRRQNTPMGENAFTNLNEKRALSINPLRLAMWGTRYLSVESTRRDPLKVDARLSINKDGKYRLELTNNGQYGLKDLFVVFPYASGRSIDLGSTTVDQLKQKETSTTNGKPTPGITAPDKKDLYAMIVKGLVTGEYMAKVRVEQSAWLFARLDEKSYAEGIRTDKNLQLSSWTAVGICPVQVFYNEIPYGSARLIWSDKKIKEETTRRGAEEVHEGRYEFSFPASTLRLEDQIESLKIRFQSRDKLSVIDLKVWEPTLKRWRPLEFDKMEEIVKAGKEEGKRSDTHEFEIPDAPALMPKGCRKIRFIYTYYQFKKSPKKKLQLRVSPKIKR